VGLMSLKGIILAGGSGTRLLPMTSVISKQLLPIYDKPMIFYPLSTLMLAGVKDILIISTPQDTNRFQQLLGDGSDLGIRIEYAIQESPKGIGEAFIIGEEFIENNPSILILGDNLFFGNELQSILKHAIDNIVGATVFAYPVKDPERYGVAGFNKEGVVTSLEEKPKLPKSNLAVTGIYLYDNKVVDIAREILPSKRGELEITAINNSYLKNKKLNLEIFGRGMTWLDTGTPETLMEASEFVKVIQKRQGLVISCPEEIAWRSGWIKSNDLLNLAKGYGDSEYKNYLISLAKY
jgi:glucose-1-phosphate thymidylyltransferase